MLLLVYPLIRHISWLPKGFDGTTAALFQPKEGIENFKICALNFTSHAKNLSNKDHKDIIQEAIKVSGKVDSFFPNLRP